MTTNASRLALFALLGEGFFSRLSFGVVSFALPLYARELGLSLTEIGLLISLNAGIAMLCKPVMGSLADRSGWRRSLLAGVGLRSVGTLLFAVSWMPWHLFGIRALLGLSQSLRSPAINALLAERGGKKSVASVFAWYATARTVAASAGRAVAGVLLALTAGKFAPVFLVAFILSAIPLLVVWRYVKEPEGRARKAPIAANGQSPTTVSAAESRPGLLPIMGLGAMMNGTAQMLHGLFPLLATEYAGLGTAETGFIYLASTLVTLAAGPIFGWLSDHVSRELVLLVRSAANIFSSAVYLFAPGLAGVTVAKLTDDMGKAAFRPAWGAMMSSASSHDPRNRARRMGIMSLGEDAGDLLGPALAGFLWSTGGIGALMGVRIVLAASTEAYAIVVARRLNAAEDSIAANEDESPLQGRRTAILQRHSKTDFTRAAPGTSTGQVNTIHAWPITSGSTKE
jgi:MFS family permease